VFGVIFHPVKVQQGLFDRVSSEVSGALSTALEKPKERLIHTPVRLGLGV
jgi:hypothetical protein